MADGYEDVSISAVTGLICLIHLLLSVTFFYKFDLHPVVVT